MERTPDNQPFAMIGRVKGNNKKTSKYNYLDFNPLTGNNYYRIKQVDFNDSVSYSPIRVIGFSLDRKNFIIYPNPLNGNTINIITPDIHSKETLVRIFDLSRRLIEKGLATLSSGKYEFKVNTLIPAVYIIEVDKVGKKYFMVE